MGDAAAGLGKKMRKRHGNSTPSQSTEELLKRACRDGTGHLMVTGSDRGEIHAALARVLQEVKPLGAIRTLACDTEPSATVDRVISAIDPGAAPDNYLDRRAALRQLVSRAAKADKSIFVVVDDADHATIEQLEQLRTCLEVAPESIERLRLVLVGDEMLREKLDAPAARALRSRITGTFDMQHPPRALSARAWQSEGGGKSAMTLAMNATVAFCAVVYTMYLFGMTAEVRDSRESAVPMLPSKPREVAPPPSRAAVYALRGDEEFLDSTLRIAALSASRAKPGRPPLMPRTEKPVAATSPPRPTAAPASTNTAPTKSTTAKPKAPQPARPPGTTPSPSSSIAAFMKRFPAAP